MSKQSVIHILVTGITACALSAASYADLYMSPVLGSKGQSQHDVSQVAYTDGRSQRNMHGKNHPDRQDANPFKYGNNIPLPVALENIVPVQGGWAINIDDGLESKLVSWEGGSTWESVLRSIAEQNNLEIAIDPREKAVGVSLVREIARHLASRTPRVWRVTKELSLRKNIDSWAGQAGWTLEWDPSLSVDYVITHDAIITGPFEGEGGAIDQLLSSLEQKSVPLTAQFYTQNHVVRVVEAGYRQDQ